MALFNYYPYSNFHELNLDWIIKAVIEYTEKVDKLEINFNELKDYVVNYFDSVDFAEIVAAKIDEMFLNGDFTTLFARYTYRTYLNKKALVEDTALVDGSIIRCLGYNSPGDNGHFDGLISTTSQGYSILLDNGLYCNVVLSHTITPEMFGAVPDGDTDCTTQLQNAMEYTENRTLEFYPGGTYVINDGSIEGTLLLKSNSILELNEATINSRGRWRLFIAATNEDTYGGYNGVHDVIIRNGYLVGGCDCTLVHMQNVYFTNVKFHNARIEHMVEIAACKNVHFENCEFVGSVVKQSGVHEYFNIDPMAYPNISIYDPESPLYDGTPNTELYVTNSLFALGEGVYAFGERAWGVHSSNLATQGKHSYLYFTDNIVRGFTIYSLTVSDMEHVIIDGNVIEGTDFPDITVGTIEASDIKITNNYMQTNGSKPCIVFGQNKTPEFISGATDVIIEGNVIVNTAAPYSTIYRFETTDKSKLSFIRLQKSNILNGNYTNSITSPINLSKVNVIELLIGAPATSNLQHIRIDSFYGRGFLVNEVYNVPVYHNGAVIIQTYTITDDFTITVTSPDNTPLNIRQVSLAKIY